MQELETAIQFLRHQLIEQMEELNSLRRQIAYHTYRTNSETLQVFDQDVLSYLQKIEMHRELLDTTYRNTFSSYSKDTKIRPYWSDNLLQECEYQFLDGLAPWQFVLKSNNSTELLADLNFKIKKYLEMMKPEPFTRYPKRGDLCLCRIQSRLLRGIYLGLTSMNKLKVAGVDVNETHELELGQVYELPDCFLDLPPQVVRCCIYTNSYIKMLWSDYFVDNFIGMMRQPLTFIIQVDSLQGDGLPPVYLLNSLGAYDVSGNVFDIKDWVENFIFPTVIEYKCAMPGELFEDGSIDSRIWNIDPPLQEDITPKELKEEKDYAVELESEHYRIGSREDINVRESEEKIEYVEPAANSVFHDEVLLERYLNSQRDWQNLYTKQEVSTEDYRNVSQECLGKTEDTSIKFKELSTTSHPLEEPHSWRLPSGKSITKENLNRICEKPKAELRLADGKSNFDENLPTQSYTDEKPLAGKLHKSQSGPLEKKFSSQRLPNGICNFNENQQTQNKTDSVIELRDLNHFFLDSVPFDSLDSNRDLDILDGSDEETQVAEILNDLANIGPTYHDEVILCPEYKSSGICSRMYCNKEHVYPIDPHYLGAVYTYVHTKRLLDLPEEGSRIFIRPLSIVNGFTFYALLVNQEHSDEPNLELLHTRMQNFAEVARYKPLELLPSLGELVLAYSRFKFWYRARIIDVGEYKAKVFSIDFGIEEALPFSRLRKINYDLLFLPPQAVRCNFYDVMPKENYDLAMQNYLKRHLLNRVVEAHVKIANEAETELELTVYLNGKNLNAHLIQKGLFRKCRC
ncbi:uncharacterized protein isoform X2 [Rhodnius prolixus]|uniref:uncharacterized protein isoform X2 n=1 Tax=Rhodnius prolixus TaxID=13249 RepID=UPI003D18AF0D